MERLSLDQDEVQTQREYALAGNARVRFGVDHYFTEAEDQAVREELVPGSKLKLFDDVRAADTTVYRAIAPAIGRSRFTAYRQSEQGALVTTLDIREVVDRAPADPREEPMPVWEEPVEEQPEEVDEEADEEEMASLRLQAFIRIDTHSDLLFASGFVFKGVLLSLSLEAQARYHNMDYLRHQFDPYGNPILSYPLTFSSLDDTTTVTINGADEIHLLYLTAVARVAQIVAEGNVQKDYIRDAARTSKELRNFSDPRPLPSIIPVEP